MASDPVAGVYVYDVVADQYGDGYIPLTSDVVRFVTPERCNNYRTTYSVRLNDDGELEVRCLEGSLLVRPNGSNEISVKVEPYR